jgi:hypothetical protein
MILLIVLLLIKVAVAGEWGPMFEIGPVMCTDSIDNDGDLMVDAFDSDCDTIFLGTLVDQAAQPIVGARVEARTGTYFKSAFTNSSGNYMLNVVSGTYDLVATAIGFAPSFTQGTGDFSEFVSVNFTLLPTDSTCKPDCTRGQANGNVCDKSCDGYNACSFGSQQIMNACDPGSQPFDGYQKNVVVPIGFNSTVKCCKGPTKTPSAAPDAKLSVTSKSKNVVTIKRVVILNGQPVTMVISVFD